MSEETTTSAAPETTTAPAEADGRAAAVAALEGADPAKQVAPAEPAPSKVAQALAARRSRQDAKLEAERAKVAEGRATLEKQMAELAPKLQLAEKYTSIERLAREDPAALLDALGVDYDELVTKKLGAKNPNARLEAIEAERAAEKKAQAEAAEAAKQQQIEEARQRDLKYIVTEARRPEAYPELDAYDDEEIQAATDGAVKAINLARMEQLIAQGVPQQSAIDRVLAKGLTFAEICRALNDGLAEKHDRIEAARAKRKAPVTPPAKVPTKPPSTLTGADGTNTTQAARDLSYAERKALAEAALGNLLGGV